MGNICRERVIPGPGADCQGARPGCRPFRLGLARLVCPLVCPLVWLALLAACVPACGQQSTAPPLKLTVAVCPTYFSSLIMLADAEGYFKDSGLDVQFKECASGNYCLESLDFDQAQLATVTDFAFAARARSDHALKIAASIASADNHEIVSRKDRAIAAPSDLRGKRVGVTFGTSADYFLYTFLVSHSIEPSAVTAVDMRPDQLAGALERGEVDAISSWDVFAWEARKRLGDNGAVWRAEISQDTHWVLAAKEEETREPEAIRRFLQALVKAQEFLLAHDAEARKTIAAKLRFDQEFMDQYWDRYRLAVSLPPSLAASLEHSFRWHIARSGRPGVVPNVLACMCPTPLGEVDPAAVTIPR